MLRIALAAALLLGSAPAHAQATIESVAARTLEQNRRVVIGTTSSQRALGAAQGQAVTGKPPGQAAPAALDRMPRPVALAQQGRATAR